MIGLLSIQSEREEQYGDFKIHDLSDICTHRNKQSRLKNLYSQKYWFASRWQHYFIINMLYTTKNKIESLIKIKYKKLSKIIKIGLHL